MSEANKWQKGQSGNPAGRPRLLFSFNRELQQKASEVDPKDLYGRTYGRKLIDRAFEIALKGPRSTRQIVAIREILDRLVGKPVQAVAVADLRPESREQLIESILETARAMKKEKEDEPGTVQ